ALHVGDRQHGVADAELDLVGHWLSFVYGSIFTIDAPMPSSEGFPSAARVLRPRGAEVVAEAIPSTKTTEVGNSSGPLLSFLVISSTLPSRVTITTALRSLAATQRRPCGSKSGPSAPSSSGLCATSAGLPALPPASTGTFQIAP